MIWFRRFIWCVAVFGWLIAILAALIMDQSPGLITAMVIGAILTWIGVFVVIAWWLGILRQAKRHLQFHPRDAELLEHRVSHRAKIDVLRALQDVCEKTDGSQFGFQAAYVNMQQRVLANPEPEKLEWQSYQTDVDDWSDVAANACFFLTFDSIRFIAAVIDDTAHRYHHQFGEETEENSPDGRIKLSILAATREECRDARDALLAHADECSVYRGRQLIVRPGERRTEPVRVEFTNVRTVDRDSIVLPDQVFDVIDRAAIRQMDVGNVLKNAGHRTRTALLMHGPPGTGKTLLTRHVMGLRDDITTIMLHGFRRGLVREAFRLARYCQPSIVVIEDVDLIAVRRRRNARGTTALHELMDELDGLAPESRTVVIMTTNRPDVLEPALASRPGRVSQAIEVPLPDAESRRRILELFTSRLDVSRADFAKWVDRTDGASPAFLEELIRRSILFATESENDGVGEKINLTDDNLEAAINEILTSGGSLTQKLLGYATP